MTNLSLFNGANSGIFFLGMLHTIVDSLIPYFLWVIDNLLWRLRPMEEQRQRYGPPLYQLTSMAIAIQIFLKLWWRHFDEIKL
jgi:hypothetical protein